jgi:hypothetical protein
VSTVYTTPADAPGTVRAQIGAPSQPSHRHTLSPLVQRRDREALDSYRREVAILFAATGSTVSTPLGIAAGVAAFDRLSIVHSSKDVLVEPQVRSWRVRVAEVVMDELNGGGALSDCGGHSFD